MHGRPTSRSGEREYYNKSPLIYSLLSTLYFTWVEHENQL